MAERSLSRPARALLALERRSERPWFLPLVGMFPLLDYALPFLPNQILLGLLSMSSPRRWIALAATFVIASALGALLFALAVQQLGLPLISGAVGDLPEGNVLAEVVATIREHGLVALVGLAMLPWPPRAAVLACAIVGLAPVEIALAVLVGRILPAGLYALLGAKAPALLRRFPKVDALMREVELERAKAVSAPDAV